MRMIDRIIRDWRYRKVEPYVPYGCRLLDIGGGDGSFLSRMRARIREGVCADPLIEERSDGKLMFIRLRVTDRLPFPDRSFDVVTMLAVYEHLGPQRQHITREVFRILNENGLALLTVPSHLVDYISKALISIRLADGPSIEEHNLFRSSDTKVIFEGCGFKLRLLSKFQLGLNNLFIFKK